MGLTFAYKILYQGLSDILPTKVQIAVFVTCFDSEVAGSSPILCNIFEGFWQVRKMLLYFHHFIWKIYVGILTQHVHLLTNFLVQNARRLFDTACSFPDNCFSRDQKRKTIFVNSKVAVLKVTLKMSYNSWFNSWNRFISCPDPLRSNTKYLLTVWEKRRRVQDSIKRHVRGVPSAKDEIHYAPSHLLDARTINSERSAPTKSFCLLQATGWISVFYFIYYC